MRFVHASLRPQLRISRRRRNQQMPQAKPADLEPEFAGRLKRSRRKRPPGPITHLTPSVIQARISEARRMLKTRPIADGAVRAVRFSL